MGMNKTLVCAGVFTLFQSIGQLIYTGLSVAQYFCLIDFLRELPILIFIKILYFHNPDTCGGRINIGQYIDGVADQAFVLVPRQPLPVFRTFVINSANLGLAAFWILASVILILSGARNNNARLIRWPWIVVAVVSCVVDLAATVTYINDTFHTRTLSDIMSLIGGSASGLGNSQLDTAAVAWLMVLWYSRGGVILLLNLVILVTIIVGCNAEKSQAVVYRDVETSVVSSEPPLKADAGAATFRTDSETASHVGAPKIPRPGLSRSFRRMKKLLFKQTGSSERIIDPNLDSESSNSSPQRSLRVDDKRTVNFPESLLSLPQRLENLMAEQQRKLDTAVVDTRSNAPRASQSLPHLASTEGPPGRRGTAAELQGQLPWAYIHATAHRMRDQLPPDEDLPPVPLPDYTAIQAHRKASVHRAASSVSSLIQRKDNLLLSSRPPLTQSDVLY